MSTPAKKKAAKQAPVLTNTPDKSKDKVPIVTLDVKDSASDKKKCMMYDV